MTTLLLLLSAALALPANRPVIPEATMLLFKGLHSALPRPRAVPALMGLVVWSCLCELPVLAQENDKKVAAAGLEVQGYFTADALQGGMGTAEGRVLPKARNARFLVVVVRLPARNFTPTEAKYKTLKAKAEGDRRPLSAAHVQVYDPARFTLTLLKSQRRPGMMISDWELDDPSKADISGFSDGGFWWHGPRAINGDQPIALAIAWILPPSAIRPPFQVQFDKEDPIPVAEKPLGLPIRSRNNPLPEGSGVTGKLRGDRWYQWGK